VAQLKAAGLLAIVVTNQPDVGAGRQSTEILGAMHARLRAAMPLDDIRVCTCDHDCPCYKPRPGLLLDAAREWGIALDRSFMVGDRWRDVGAGRAAGCTTYFIDRGYVEPLRERPDFVVADLAEAARHILGRGPLGETGEQ
ncbi:MAG: HAD-IIIA family hydrolase, partial [Alphaproteobacteria bacterium]